jgi:hypothetical protein
MKAICRRKPVSENEKSLSSSDAKDDEYEDSFKGNRRKSGGNAVKYCRRIGCIVLLVVCMVGGPLLFLDSRGFIFVPFLRHVRTVLHVKLVDPKNMDTIEQTTGLKTMSLEQHGILTKELNETRAKVEEKEREVAALGARLAQSKKGQAAAAEFCGECKWQGRFSCEERKAFVMKRYGESEETVLANLVQLSQCQKAVKRRLRGSHD